MRRILKAAALVVLLAAAAGAVPERSSQTIESHTFDHKTTAKKRHELRVPGEGTRVRMWVKASVREGEIRIVLRNAAGLVWHEGILAPSDSKPGSYDVDSGEVKSEAGVWTVEVEAKGAVGSYEFIFTQKGR